MCNNANGILYSIIGFNDIFYYYRLLIKLPCFILFACWLEFIYYLLLHYFKLYSYWKLIYLFYWNMHLFAVFASKYEFIRSFFQNMHFWKPLKMKKICKIKINITDSISYRTNLQFGFQCARLNEKLWNSHKHLNPKYTLRQLGT